MSGDCWVFSTFSCPATSPASGSAIGWVIGACCWVVGSAAPVVPPVAVVPPGPPGAGRAAGAGRPAGPAGAAAARGAGRPVDRFAPAGRRVVIVQIRLVGL